MRLPRIRFTVGGLILAVAVFALVSSRAQAPSGVPRLPVRPLRAINRNANRQRAVAAVQAHFVSIALCISAPALAQTIRLVDRAPNPHGSPRPARDARDVPMRTSLYFELAAAPADKTGTVSAQTVTVSLQAEGAAAVELLGRDRHFAARFRAGSGPNKICKAPGLWRSISSSASRSSR